MVDGGVGGAGGGGRLARRGRDRHGRGLRGALTPPGVPLSRSRAQRFDDVVLDAVEHLEAQWGDALAGVEFLVEDVPGVDVDPAAPGADSVPLGRTTAASDRQPARVVIYRRPIEARVTGRGDLADLVHDVVVDQVAALLGLDPDVVDPPYDD